MVTDDADLVARVRSLRGLGSRMSEIEAAVLRLLLPLLDADNARRRAIAARYRETAPELAWAAGHPEHVYHLCVARERERIAGALPFSLLDRDPLPRASTQEPAYARYTRAPCPNAEEWARTCVTLPCFPEMTDAEVTTVAERLATLDPGQLK